ncbi:pyrroline-5-carboxylate reductase [Salinisphaera sp. PC39]|uniref:pyrroline-5-carboxylate reductase n=1 Tax=Salinisphaera sp. PC39 TaxID=1304156 RepID=UPI0033425C6F
MHDTIVFIGGGNMAASLIGGLRHAGHPADRIRVVEPDAGRRESLSADQGVTVAADADAALLAADVWVLAVKPQMMAEVATGLAPMLPERRPVVMSVAAGVPTRALAGWLGGDVPLVRCMPNTPALIGAGASGLFALPSVGETQRASAEAVAAAAGTVVWVAEESALDAVTATSGSGPAYFFRFMEAMQAGAEDLGLPPETARELVLHTALGAARMALESGDDPATLRAKVTSPGGTTERALAAFEDGNLQALVTTAMRAAADRSRELGAGFDAE